MLKLIFKSEYEIRIESYMLELFNKGVIRWSVRIGPGSRIGFRNAVDHRLLTSPIQFPST
jgi:hypothetical protein